MYSIPLLAINVRETHEHSRPIVKHHSRHCNRQV